MTPKQVFEFKCMELLNKKETGISSAFISPQFTGQVLILEWTRAQWRPRWFFVLEVAK